MPSNWMGGNQSWHKASFEEALHSSIENSLRSHTVAPSSVFSSLFFTFRPSSTNNKHEVAASSDVKPSVDELEPKINRPASNQVEHVTPNSSTAYPQCTSRPSFPVAIAETRGPPAFVPSSSSDEHHRVQLSERKTFHNDGRQSMAPPQAQLPPLLSQHQQLEQIQHARIEQLKQLQKLQAWQQMQKEQQQSGSRLLMPLSAPSRDQHPAALLSGPTPMRPNLPNISRSSNSTALSTHVNGLLPNGAIPPAAHAPVSIRPESLLHHKGYCKSGQDIRLSRFEGDASKLVPCPSEYILFALQPLPVRADLLIVVAINLKSLPPQGNSSQALSAQCVGCGEKSIHTFAHLASHVGIEPSPDPAHARLNSSQLIGPLVRFYLIRDATNSHKLIRGSPAIWYKANEDRMRSLAPLGGVSAAPVNSPLFRGSMIMVSPPHQEAYTMATPVNEGAPNALLSPSANGVTSGRPHLKRALSNPMQRNNAVEVGKRQYASLSNDEIVVIREDPSPKRYVLEGTVDSRQTVQIPEDLAAKQERRPVIAFLRHTTDLPRFVGDLSALLVTSEFSQSYKSLSMEARSHLGFPDKSLPFFNTIVLCSTVQYLINLGSNKDISADGLSTYLVRALQKFCSDEHGSYTDFKPSTVLALCRLAAATSNGLVEIVQCEVMKNQISMASAITQSLRSYRSSEHKYRLLVYSRSDAINDIEFHLFISGKFCRAVEESLQSADERLSVISQGLVSYQFSQLHLSLSGDVARKCFYNKPTSKSTSSFDDNSVLAQHTCSGLQKGTHFLASLLLDKVEKIFHCSDNFDLAEFTTLQFLFLLPSGSSLLPEALRSITRSNILTEISKSSHHLTSSPSHFIVTSDDASLQRISSACEQVESTSTLLILIHLAPHSARNSGKVTEYLNSATVVQSKNIFTIQCSSHPYPLLTESSRIPPSHVVTLEEGEDAERSFGNTSISSCLSSSVFDPTYELHKLRLIDRYESLHSSLIACELLTHQYIKSLAITSSADSGQDNTDSSPVINQIARDLCHPSSSSVVIVRITSSILATRFYDGVKRARARLGLDENFEVLFYKAEDSAPTLSVSSFFLDVLRSHHDNDQDWFPASLSDLCGISCLIVYEGNEVFPQPMPRTLKYVDLRLVLTGRLSRCEIERELSLAAPLCSPERKQHVTNNHNQSASVDECKIEMLKENQNNYAGHPYENGKDPTFKWTTTKPPIENGFRNKDEKELNGGKRGEALFDFIGLAMKEADLPADDKCEGHHSSPIVIVPESVYDVINGKTTHSIYHLLPHPSCTWKEPLHPPLNSDALLEEQASYYRKWTAPTEKNPDYINSNHVIDHTRLLLVTPPACSSPLVCCHFLRSLHSKLMKALDTTVYDDAEEDGEDRSEFRTLMANNVERGISQVVNSCIDDDSTRRFIAPVSDQGHLQRSVVTIRYKHALTSLKRLREASNVSNSTHLLSQVEFPVSPPIKDGCGNGDRLRFRIFIPRTHANRFRFPASESGNLDGASLLLRRKVDDGIKTPVVSIADHRVTEGAYNLSAGGDAITHVIIVRSRDARLYQSNLNGKIIAVLPDEYDVLGKGALKQAARLLFDHFYTIELSSTNEAASIWPYFLLKDDDVIAFSHLYQHREGQANNSPAWENVPFTDVIATFELFARDDVAAVGFRPWSSKLPTSISRENACSVDDYFSRSCLESCIFFNLQLSSSVAHGATKFTNEDIDWSLRAAASGLKLLRFENIAMVTKVTNPLESAVELSNVKSPLVTTADSEFEPLHHHPGLLLEKYLHQCGHLVFSIAVGIPARPVLCVDCYFSLGNQICVQFVSTESEAEQWSSVEHKQYGGLILSSPNPSVQAEFLQRFQFADGAVVCVIGSDRNILRQTVVHLQLETAWHFRLTDEFQTTANHLTLGGAGVRPLYFLTGVKKKGP